MLRVKAQGKAAAEVLIYGPIGDDWLGDGVTASRFREDLEALGEVEDITVRINSPGGIVWDGVAIYNTLKEHPAEVLVHVDGIAASSASLVAMAGDVVVMGTASQMMIHNPWSFAIGDAEDMRKNAEVLDQIRDGMIEAYVAKTGLSSDEVRDMMDAETWMLADMAIDNGFADERSDAAPAEPAEGESEERAQAQNFNTWSPVLARYRNAPDDLKAPRGSAGNPKSASAGAEPTSKEDEMKGNEASTPTAGKVTDEQAAVLKNQGATAEHARSQGIRDIFAKFGDEHNDLRDKCIDNVDCTVEAANEKLLKAIAAGRESLAPEIIEDEHDKRVLGIESGILARAPQARAAIAKAGAKQPDSESFKIANPGEFRGMSLFDMVRADLERMQPGASRGKSKRAVVAAYFRAAASYQTTSDFSVALENTLNKTLLAAYAIAPDTWREFCAVGEVSDFRAHNRYRTGYMSSLGEVPESGEFTQSNIPDAVKETIQAATYGNIVGLSRQAIINDDMGVFNRVAVQLGRAAGLTIEELVYALLAQNSGLGPLMADGKTLFHADHGNIGGGAALTAAAIDTDGALMENQQDPEGNEYIGARPSVLLVPRALRGTAISINESEFDPDTADSNKPNTVRGFFDTVIATPRLAGTRRYLFADPMEMPCLEVAFLDGEQDPYLEMKEGWGTDGMEYKVRHDVAVAGVEYRGGVTDAGG